MLIDENKLKQSKPCQFDATCCCLEPDKISKNWCLSCFLGSVERVTVSLTRHIVPIKMTFGEANLIRRDLEDLLQSIELSVKWFEKYEPKYRAFIKEVVTKEREEVKKYLQSIRHPDLPYRG